MPAGRGDRRQRIAIHCASSRASAFLLASSATMTAMCPPFRHRDDPASDDVTNGGVGSTDDLTADTLLTVTMKANRIDAFVPHFQVSVSATQDQITGVATSFEMAGKVGYAAASP